MLKLDEGQYQDVCEVGRMEGRMCVSYYFLVFYPSVVVSPISTISYEVSLAYDPRGHQTQNNVYIFSCETQKP